MKTENDAQAGRAETAHKPRNKSRNAAIPTRGTGWRGSRNVAIPTRGTGWRGSRNAAIPTRGAGWRASKPGRGGTTPSRGHGSATRGGGSVVWSTRGGLIPTRGRPITKSRGGGDIVPSRARTGIRPTRGGISGSRGSSSTSDAESSCSETNAESVPFLDLAFDEDERDRGYVYSSLEDVDEDEEIDEEIDGEIDDDPGPPGLAGRKEERYSVTCPEVSSRWPHHGVEFELILPSLSVWGKFDFGVVSGTILFQDANKIEWRGVEEDGTVHCDSECGSFLPSWIKFLRGGRRIEGYLGGTMNLAFTGVRDPGHKAGKAVSAEAIERTHEAFSRAPSVKIWGARRAGRWPRFR
ncbi:hypothetical protein GE09DRAFT_273744 [Coniochaeta sp. 2T2.1]|nr:hypothetical protein GE09DRAFT_273744 [Coniochaeta sp. 2T2.1]